MKIAFISDIHANFPALLRAFASAEKRGAESVIVLGDIVGGGPNPAEVVRFLMGRNVQAIKGNMENKIIRLDRPSRKGKLGNKKKDNYIWTARNIGEEEMRWIRDLPESLNLDYGGAGILAVHGSPLSDVDCIYPSINAPALRKKCQGTTAGVLVCGHTHIPFAKIVSGIRVVNCGSVGRPVDGDPRGSYAMMDFQEGMRPRINIIRFSYPLKEIVADLSRRKVPCAFPEEYLHGIKRKGA